ncbi:MAG: tetratricopeptide repeat protein [Bryobacteraceae bacterium]|jgi:tetratricopeptide (TPR) repeat protein
MSRVCIAAILLACIAFAADAPRKTAPADPSTTARHATQLAESGHCDQALTLLTKSVPHLPNGDLEKTVGLDGIKCAMTMNQMDAAADFVRILLRDFPKDPQVLYVAAHVYSDLSIRASQTLLYTAPGSYQVHQLNAEALEMQGKWDDAAAEYRQVLQQNPKLPGMHYRLGRIVLSKPPTAASNAEARKEFQAELEIDPSNAGAEYVLGELARQDRNYVDAIAHFGAATKLDRTFADAFIGLGRSLVADGKVAEAQASLETAVKLQPGNAAAHYHLGVVYQRTGRKDDAAREFALRKEISDKNRQLADDVHAGIVGPQEPEP